jgi:hypothetical protein
MAKNALPEIHTGQTVLGPQAESPRSHEYPAFSSEFSSERQRKKQPS